MPTVPYKNKLGKRVRGVTTFIKRQCAWGAEKLQYWFWKEGAEGRNFQERTEKLATSGTLTHDKVEAYMLGKDRKEMTKQQMIDLVGEEGYTRCINAWQSFLSWVKAYNPVTYATEQHLISEEYQFGGTFDWVGDVVDGFCIVDWKASVYANYLIQIAAYRQLWNENHPDKPVEKAHILKLGKDSATFVHVSVSKEDLDLAFEGFRIMQRLDVIQGRLEKLL